MSLATRFAGPAVGLLTLALGACSSTSERFTDTSVGPQAQITQDDDLLIRDRSDPKYRDPLAATKGPEVIYADPAPAGRQISPTIRRSEGAEIYNNRRFGRPIGYSRRSFTDCVQLEPGGRKFYATFRIALYEAPDGSTFVDIANLRETRGSLLGLACMRPNTVAGAMINAYTNNTALQEELTRNIRRYRPRTPYQFRDYPSSTFRY